MGKFSLKEQLMLVEKMIDASEKIPSEVKKLYLRYVKGIFVNLRE